MFPIVLLTIPFSIELNQSPPICMSFKFTYLFLLHCVCMIWGENLACQHMYESQKRRRIYGVGLCFHQGSPSSHQTSAAHSKCPCLMNHLACGFKFEEKGLMWGGSRHHSTHEILESVSSRAHSLQSPGWAESMGAEPTYSYFLSWVTRGRLNYGAFGLAHWCA